MKILIVKHGALGDVVRTSYFARALKLKFKNSLELFWYTSVHSRELLQSNPYIDHVVTNISDISKRKFDHIYSLDDEDLILENILCLDSKRLTGAYIHEGVQKYTEDAAVWFDMGLISVFGKAHADILKKTNTLGHTKIFEQIFEVKNVVPYFFKDPHDTEDTYFNDLKSLTLIGINPYAGQRWPSKEIPQQELRLLIENLLNRYDKNEKFRLLLFGAGQDRIRNMNMASLFDKKDKIIVLDTDQCVMKLAKYISILNLLITSDSLAMHLAIAQRINTVAFFAPTSAEEIDDFGKCIKLKSLSSDYCSYIPSCDNTSITSSRILDSISNIQF